MAIRRAFVHELSGEAEIERKMRREDAIEALQAAEPDLKARGVVHAALFGSVARGDNGPESDLDILIEIGPDARMDVYAYVGIVHAIEDLFPIRVDVANRMTLKDHIRAHAEQDAVYGF